MENSLTNNNQELNGQNIPQDKAQISSVSPEENEFPQFFSVANLKKQFSTPINMNGIGSEPNRTFKRYKSDKIKKFLSNKDDDNNNKKKLGTIKEIVIDDQNENMVDNNPKNRFKVKEGKKNNEEEKKKKLNIIEELRNFDRKQQISMEQYINNIKQKKFEYAYKKNLKNNYQKLNYYNNDLNNGLLSQENNKEEIAYNSPAEKDINDNEIIIEKEEIKSPFKTELKKRNDSDEFERLKQKYFSKNIFSSRFPNSEYKVKYLNNYFNKDSVVRNLFGQYNENKQPPQEQNNNSINNNNNNNNNISPKLIYKNNNLSLNNNNNSEIKNSNNRYNSDNNSNNINNNEQSLNSNKTSLIKSYKHSSSKYNYNENNEIENKYNKVFNSINERLYKNQLKKKYSNVDNINIIKSPSSDKIKTNFNYNSSILDKNKSYNFFSGRSNKSNNRYDYNNFKLNFNFFSKKF